MQIEEAIKELRESYELKHRQWAYNCLDVIKEELENSRKATTGIYDDYQDLGKEYYKIQCELEKKDALIDVMAEWINKQDIDEEICKNNITQPELCNEYGTNCRQCIKEYFYKKVRWK